MSNITPIRIYGQTDRQQLYLDGVNLGDETMIIRAEDGHSQSHVMLELDGKALDQMIDWLKQARELMV